MRRQRNVSQCSNGWEECDRSKLSERETTVVDESEPVPQKRGGNVVDLMPLLKKSLEKSSRPASRAKRASSGGGRKRSTRH